MADRNKVLFGFSDLYVGTYTVDDEGTVTMGTPYHQPGAVGFSPEEQGENYTFYADNTSYFTYYTSGKYEGDLEVAKFDDAFKKQFMGYKEFAGGGLAQIRNAVKPNVYIMFEMQGDTESRRVLFYNASLGGINRSYATIEENVEVQTETIPVTVNGDGGSGMSMVVFSPGDTAYENLFTNPPAPELEDDSE